MHDPAAAEKNDSKWVRILYMILFGIVFNVAELVMWVTVVFQVVVTIVTGRPNEQVRQFGQSLSIYVYEIWRFLTYNSEAKPFPFGEWPEPSKRTD
jgi:hypothetical protein